MRIRFEDFPIYLTNGTEAGQLDGEYEATPNKGQQPGWFALQKVNDDGSIDPEIAANVYISGGAVG